MPKGQYTQKVIENYQISNTIVPAAFVRNYIIVKLAYAQTNHANGKLADGVFEQINANIEKLLKLGDKELSKLLPLDRFQSGGGTSTNMPINELIAFYADTKDLHPNDHVNMSQSSNDTFPGVAKITFIKMLPELTKALEDTINLLEEKAHNMHDVTKVGRTHLQDALPMNVGEEFLAFTSTLSSRLKQLQQLSSICKQLALGGTAIGTKQSIDDQIRKQIIENINQHFQQEFSQPENYPAQISSSSDFLTIATTLSLLANDLIKINSDIRLLASGPRAGFNELRLPEVQAGSSIMPGKVNPSIAEALTMICLDVIGKTHTVELANLHAQLQLQQFNPIIVWNIYDSLLYLTAGLHMFNEKLLKGLVFNTKAIKKNLDYSLVRATELSEKLGYDEVAKRVKDAVENDSALIID